MGKYLTEFSSTTEYNNATSGLSYPNVSLVGSELKYASELPVIYRWVVDGTICGDDSEHEGEWRDGCSLYEREKKQQSINGGATWTDVVPAEYRYGEFIEEDSQECGCGEPVGEGCRDIDLADDQGESYNGELVQGVKFGWLEAEPSDQATIYVWDYYVSEYIGRVTCEVDAEDATIKTVYIYDDSDTLIATLNHYAEWDDWVRLCEYFDGRCMKLSMSDNNEFDYPYDGFPIIIKVDDSGENCDCGCLDE